MEACEHAKQEPMHNNPAPQLYATEGQNMVEKKDMPEKMPFPPKYLSQPPLEGAVVASYGTSNIEFIALYWSAVTMNYFLTSINNHKHNQQYVCATIYVFNTAF